jgi:hypothetical protein
MLTDRDKETLKHIEDYDFITIKQLQNIIYNTQNFGYDIARKRLNKLVEKGKIKVFKDIVSNQNVYYYEKKPSYHDIIIMDFYSELIREGVNMLFFQKRFEWLNKDVISDGFCCYFFNGKFYSNLIEVCYSHHARTSVEKYQALYDSREAHNFISGVTEGVEIKFPKLILIDNVEHTKPFSITKDVDIKQLDFNLKSISKIFF